MTPKSFSLAGVVLILPFCVTLALLALGIADNLGDSQCLSSPSPHCAAYIQIGGSILY